MQSISRPAGRPKMRPTKSGTESERARQAWLVSLQAERGPRDRLAHDTAKQQSSNNNKEKPTRVHLGQANGVGAQLPARLYDHLRAFSTLVCCWRVFASFCVLLGRQKAHWALVGQFSRDLRAGRAITITVNSADALHCRRCTWAARPCHWHVACSLARSLSLSSSLPPLSSEERKEKRRESERLALALGCQLAELVVPDKLEPHLHGWPIGRSARPPARSLAGRPQARRSLERFIRD